MASRRNRKWCQVCDGHRDQVGKISARKKCASCGDDRLLSNLHQLQAHGGPWFDHWRRRSLAALGVVLVDESPRES